MTQAKQDLDVEDFSQAGITAVKFSASQLDGLLPIAVHTARLYMSSNSKHIVQALLQLRVQRLGQMVAFHRIHPVYRLRQLVQLLEKR